VTLDASPGFEQRLAFTIRVPIGVVLAITPFNAPLNTVCHKIGPALAAGNAVILKPAEYTPLTAQALVHVFRDADVPEGYLQILYGPGSEVGLRLLRDSRIGFTTFTGSTEVGASVKRETGLRPVSLELGSISATIVCEDADLDRAAADVAKAGFRKAGQVCTSVQRLFVQASVERDFVARLADRVAALKGGDPADVATDVGPLISESAAAHAESLVQDSVQSGAAALVGGSRAGAHFAPTLLHRVQPRDEYRALGHARPLGAPADPPRRRLLRQSEQQARRRAMSLCSSSGVRTASLMSRRKALPACCLPLCRSMYVRLWHGFCCSAVAARPT